MDQGHAEKIAREDAYRVHSPEDLRVLVAEALMSEEVHASLRPGKPYGIDFFGRTRSRRVLRAMKKRAVEPTPRSEWVAVPVCLEGSGLDRATADAATSRPTGRARRPAGASGS